MSKVLRSLIVAALCIVAAGSAWAHPAPRVVVLLITRHGRPIVVRHAPGLLPDRVFLPKGAAASALLMFVPDAALGTVRTFVRVTPTPKNDKAPEPPVLIYQEEVQR